MAAVPTLLAVPGSNPAVDDPRGPLARVMDGIALQASVHSTAQGVRSLYVIASNYENSLKDVAQNILASPALTERVLKAANSAHLGNTGTVTDVARGVVLLGYDAVRTLALALSLLEHVQDRGHQTTITMELARTLASSTVARELATVIGADQERACLEGTLRSLGRMLVAAHAPDMLPIIRAAAARHTLSEDAAANRVLGASLTEISAIGAQSWDVADEFLASLGKERTTLKLSALAAVAGVEVAEAAWLSGSLQSPRVFAALSDFSESTGCNLRDLEAALTEAQKKFERLACAMGLPSAIGTTTASDAFADVPAKRSVEGSFRIAPAAEKDAMGRPTNFLPALNSAIMEVAEHAANGEGIDTLMAMALEALHHLAGFQRAVLFFRDPTANKSWRARIAVGADAEQIRTSVYIPSFEKPHLLSAAFEREACVAISDASTEKVVKVLPPWFQKKFPGARSFVLLPLVVRGRSIGGLYADRNCVDTSNGEEELRLLVAMRNNLVLAVKAAT